MVVPIVPDDIAAAIVDPNAYGEFQGLLEKFAWLRRELPVGQVQIEGYRPFWAITRHADILAVSKDNKTFHNGKASIVISPVESEKLVEQLTGGSPHLIKSLVQMDAPEHTKYRQLAQDWFMPANLRKLEGQIRQIARDAVNKMADVGGECDFARLVAAPYPLHVVMQILGVPPEDEPRMLRLTQEFFGSQDPDLNRSAQVQVAPEDMTQMLAAVAADFYSYFAEITADRKANPRDDLASVIANGLIDGEPIPPMDIAGYYIIVATAGHDTTSAATGNALWALASDPEQFARVKADRSLLQGLIEEAIRWSTPVLHFMRTAIIDTEIGGVPIKKGDWLMLCYASGNYDETVFEDPGKFNVSRWPNRHIAFGSGAHQCLGLHMARMEMRILFEELLDRLECVELAGEARRANSTFVSGMKTLPIRYKLLGALS